VGWCKDEGPETLKCHQGAESVGGWAAGRSAAHVS